MFSTRSLVIRFRLCEYQLLLIKPGLCRAFFVYRRVGAGNLFTRVEVVYTETVNELNRAGVVLTAGDGFNLD